MSDLTFSEFIRRYNGLYKENTEIYHRLARHFGLSDSAFWILYTLREAGGCVQLSQLCGELFLSKQTVHSALKQLEGSGFLRLENLPNSRKSKLVRVTERGELLLGQVVDPVLAMEERAFLRLTPQQRRALLELEEALLLALRQESAQMLQEPLCIKEDI